MQVSTYLLIWIDANRVRKNTNYFDFPERNKLDARSQHMFYVLIFF